MNINDLKFSEVMQLKMQLDEFKAATQGLIIAPSDHVSSIQLWEIGKNYFIRTVTMYCLGKLKAIVNQELLLEDASWVADCGRFHECQKTGKLNEVEPFVNDVIINRSSIIDATVWNHTLPSSVIE